VGGKARLASALRGVPLRDLTRLRIGRTMAIGVERQPLLGVRQQTIVGVCVVTIGDSTVMIGMAWMKRTMSSVTVTRSRVKTSDHSCPRKSNSKRSITAS
jgi:hypothetical protein